MKVCQCKMFDSVTEVTQIKGPTPSRIVPRRSTRSSARVSTFRLVKIRVKIRLPVSDLNRYQDGLCS